jgi:hypothetical protein
LVSHTGPLPLPVKFNAEISKYLVRLSGQFLWSVDVLLIESLHDFGMLSGEVNDLHSDSFED